MLGNLLELINHSPSPEYYQIVDQHFNELKQFYPYSKKIIFPTATPSLVVLEVIAVKKSIIERVLATEADLCGSYSKKVLVVIPLFYPYEHCQIFGGSWIDKKVISNSNKHFYLIKNESNVQFCVGVPNSTKNLDNVLLENIRTVESTLLAYEKFQKGKSEKLELISYSHGEEGINEYEKDKKKHVTRKNR